MAVDRVVRRVARGDVRLPLPGEPPPAESPTRDDARVQRAAERAPVGAKPHSRGRAPAGRRVRGVLPRRVLPAARGAIRLAAGAGPYRGGVSRRAEHALEYAVLVARVSPGQRRRAADTVGAGPRVVEPEEPRRRRDLCAVGRGAVPLPLCPNTRRRTAEAGLYQVRSACGGVGRGAHGAGVARTHNALHRGRQALRGERAAASRPPRTNGGDVRSEPQPEGYGLD